MASVVSSSRSLHMDRNEPCFCQRCGWLGKLHDAHELQTDPPLQICPCCATETEVQILGRKGLDRLRKEHELLVKMGFSTHMSKEQKMERRAFLERFFEHIHEPLKDKLEIKRV